MLEKIYYWKELTDDGLLKEPNPCGPYYSQEKLNNWGCGYISKSEAKEELEKFCIQNRNCAPHSVVLITEYIYTEIDNTKDN